MTIQQVKPVHETLQSANVQSVVFCTVKYVERYILLAGPDGSIQAWATVKAAEKSWKRNYTRLARSINSFSLQAHFTFFKPMLHVVTDLTKFETVICPEPRQLIDAEYITGNVLGYDCNVENT